jgi:hypothetical protein
MRDAVPAGGIDHAIVVALPGEAGRAACAAWQRAFRAIDGDPFEDVAWGIVTGPTPEVAMRIAGRTEPVVLASALGTTPLPASAFARAMWFSEGVQGEVHCLEDGAWTVQARGTEQSRAFAQEWSADWADLVFTSGRSNEMRCWSATRTRAAAWYPGGAHSGCGTSMASRRRSAAHAARRCLPQATA